MKYTIGQVLRIVGLLIEFWGIYGVFGADRAGQGAEGVTTRYWPMVALMVGFVVWIIGRVVIYYGKRERKQAGLAVGERWL